MNKEKKQSWIKKLYTSPNHRIFSISATVILFIMIFMGCICYELLQNREAVIQAYEDDQEDYLQLLAYNIQFRSQEKIQRFLLFYKRRQFPQENGSLYIQEVRKCCGPRMRIQRMH